MKQATILTLIFLGCATSYGQQSKISSNKNFIEWTTGTSHDFGAIRLNTIVSYSFEFTNTGTKPIVIIKVTSDCNCTVPDYSKEPISPGEKGIVKITFDAHKPGVFEKIITVKMKKEKAVVLEISGEVIQ